MKTYQPKKKEVERNWHLVDARGEVLGRLASEIAKFLMGKHKITYSRQMDMGDYVVVLNCEKVRVTGKKKKQKIYPKHSGYPGGFKEVQYEKLLSEKPEEIIRHAVSGMLPKNRLKSERMRRLRVVVGGDNPYKDKFEN